MKSTFENKLGARIKHLRVRREMTQKELAMLVNTTSTTISNYEVGYSKPDDYMLKEIANALQISTSYFTDGIIVSKINQPLYINSKINFFYINNVDGIITADDHLCNGCITLPCTNEFNNQRVFATQLVDNSMAKSKLENGTCIIVNCDIPVKNGNIVVAYIKQENRIVVRQFMTDGSMIFLNDNSYLSKSDMMQYYLKDVQIVGTVVKGIININN